MAQSAADSDPDGGRSSDIDTSALRSALEYALLIAEETQKRKPPMPIPSVLRPLFGKRRIPTAALGRVRRAIESDDVFRQRIAAGASPELVDEVGLLWLQRPSGWQSTIVSILAEAQRQADDADFATALRRAERRRVAAEEVAVRARAESVRLSAVVDAQRIELDERRAELARANEALDAARADVVVARNEARHARDREAATSAKLESIRVGQHEPDFELPVDVAESVRPTGAGRITRRPLRLTGGIMRSSAEAAAFLLRSGATVIVDGYNVAMLGWPGLSLAAQRDALLVSVQNLALRFGSEITIVFDGTDVVGAHTKRRSTVRVIYSPPGITADDVIRAEVQRTPPERHVVVVTNDAEIVRDVRSVGANVLPSNALLAIT